MKIYTNIELIDNRYHVEIDINELSAHETELISQLGEPIIDAGSNFSGQQEDIDNPGEYYEVNFTLPVRHRRIPSDFPIKQIFDLVDYADADKMAKFYADTINKRIKDAKDTLVTETPDYISETLNTI